ncbi:MAG: helix-turn-helix transcriptional regulator [Paucibacter sp.]|nr:helix-turn-helix transcriptional regulator [Roseateles sp.]
MPKTKKALTSREVFARNLRRARRLKDMTQEALALDAGVQRGYLSRVEAGAVNISLDKADALSKAVGVQLRDLVDPTRFSDIDESPAG